MRFGSLRVSRHHDEVHRPDQKVCVVFKDLLWIVLGFLVVEKVMDDQETWSVGSWEHQGILGDLGVWEPLLIYHRPSFKELSRGTGVSDSF